MDGVTQNLAHVYRNRLQKVVIREERLVDHDLYLPMVYTNTA